MFFHPKIAISQNKDERLCKEHELEGVSSLILDFEAVRMNADGLHLSRLSKGHMESLNRIAKNLKKNDSRTFSLKDFTNPVPISAGNKMTAFQFAVDGGH